MKKCIPYLFLLFVAIVVASCVEDDPIVETTTVEFPDKFNVDIPASINSAASEGLNGRLEGDGDGIIEGHEIYQSVPYFIHLADESAKILNFVLAVGGTLEQFELNEYDFVSQEDGRNKQILIHHDVTRGGQNYEYEMTLHDVDDDALALQLFWNTNPVNGIAILKPYNINRIESVNEPNAMMKIEYSEDDADYDATMIVSISGVVAIKNGDVDNIKLFAGKKGDVVDVRGNSNHPNVILFNNAVTTGRNYAFVGRGDDVKNIGVINLALPPSDVNTAEVFTDYNVYSVLEDEINAVSNLDQAIIDEVLREAHSPAYFNAVDGFITSGEGNAPDGFSSEFVNLSGMFPYIPKDVRDLEVVFISN